MAAAPRGVLEQHVAGMAERRDVERAGRSEHSHELCGRMRACPATFTARNNATYLVMIG